ncbi:DUF4329 domain-containing protein [Octadecabacter sp. G9-8]|uniref:DUF4329 domain-containing protein n=1 Tax=Octadecabacter dasysiphoniae TaxID=2909341 RepID=A0ABS9CQT7_9RHOB|nr:DUF4329 domain-containing protein [Octadecabacter dasysiphoniae]MCF2869603.1 DUF4329 domain-containing protein [Octadecabacter dasysiphoniae]
MKACWILALVPTGLLAQSIDEEALARAIFQDLNPVSIRANVEYCGYVGFTAEGELAYSQPTRGDEGSCLSDDPDNLELITASYHTHGAHSPDYSSELPSGTDMEGDEDEGIDGWVATPGGRLWYIDTTDMITRQICGIGCLPSDPNFVSGESGIIEQSYSYDELVIKLDE